jgi:flagellar hook-associated protein 3 FlgL
MRIPNLTISEALVSRLNNLNYKQNLYNEQLSSGQRITLLSEDPQAASRILRLRSEQASVQVYSKNSERALSVAQASFSALDQIRSLNDRAGELATLGSSNTVSPAERKAYAVELNQLIKQAVDAANSKYQGEYLFNGVKTDLQPFADDGTATPSALPTTPGPSASLSGATYSADSTGAITKVTVASTASLAVGMTISGTGIPAGTTVLSITNGTEFVLSNAVPATSSPTPTAFNDGPLVSVSDSVQVSPFTSGAGNTKIGVLIKNLISLRKALDNVTGDADGGTAKISAARTALLGSENDIIGIIADNAALQTRYESLKAQADARFANSQSLISKDADVDVAQTMVDLTRTRTSYQAALEAGSQVMKLSLLDYIR